MRNWSEFYHPCVLRKAVNSISSLLIHMDWWYVTVQCTLPCVSVVWFSQSSSIEAAESPGSGVTNTCTTPWGNSLSKLKLSWENSRFMICDFKSAPVALKQMNVPVPLHGWWQYLCLLSRARLNDSGSSICGNVWHLDLMRKKSLATMKLISGYTKF